MSQYSSGFTQIGPNGLTTGDSMKHIQAKVCGVLQLELPETSAFPCPLTCSGCDVTLKVISISC